MLIYRTKSLNLKHNKICFLSNVIVFKKTALFLEHNNKTNDENDFNSKNVQTLDDKLDISSHGRYINKGFPNEIKQQCEEIHDYENKINNLLLKKITEFLKENKY